jgi:ElaB/YqjD/DUF883 family membrane-anchored ribosome-binding protein
MDHTTTQGSSKATGFSTSPGEHIGGSIANSMSRGNEAVGAAAAEAMESGWTDFKTLQDDLNNLKDTVTKFISRTGNEAAKSAREITTNIAGQVGGVASDMADKGANMATVATNQAKAFGNELENMARRNPLGAIAGAVIVGVLIGMMGRRS